MNSVMMFTEDIFIWSVGQKRGVKPPFNCALEILLLTLLLTYLLIVAHFKFCTCVMNTALLFVLIVANILNDLAYEGSNFSTLGLSKRFFVSLFLYSVR